MNIRVAIVNIVAMNIRVNVPFQIMIFSRYTPRSGIAGSYGSFIFSSFKEVFFKGSSMLFPIAAIPIYFPTNM